MEFFDSNGVRIAFQQEGRQDGLRKPVILIHGFASNSDINWRYTGWFETLLEADYWVIAIDNRGHGESEKLYDSEQYYTSNMVDDAEALMDHLGISSSAVMGYSMGARITATMAVRSPHRIECAILAGMGRGLIDGVPGSEEIQTALLVDDPSAVTGVQGTAFRTFADQTKSDRKALAACIAVSRESIEADALKRVTKPVLVAVGTKDDVAGDGQELADLFPNGDHLPIPRRDHMRAVGDKVYKQGVVEFLNQYYD